MADYAEKYFINNESLSAAGTATSTVVELNQGKAMMLIESASGLTAKLQRFNSMSGNWIDVTNNSGTLTTFTLNGTYTISNTTARTRMRIVVTAGSGNFTIET